MTTAHIDSLADMLSNSMKYKIYDEIRTLVDVHSDFGDRLIPKGTMGAIVECYEQPLEGYAVDLAIPDERSVSAGSANRTTQRIPMGVRFRL